MFAERAEWRRVMPCDLPMEIHQAFPSGIIDAITRVGRRHRWYVVQARRDQKFYAWTPSGVLMTEGRKGRRRWFRTLGNCRATIDLHIEGDGAAVTKTAGPGDER